MNTIENVLCRLTDGTGLISDVYLPDEKGTHPVILIRTPYGKNNIFHEQLYANPTFFTQAGYAVVIQDVRGTGESSGTLAATGENEYQDGYDSVEWVAKQPFCNGKVGMCGLSYFGFTQIAAASLRPPSLYAICPFQAQSQAPYGASMMRTLNGFHLHWLYAQAMKEIQRYVPDAIKRQKVLALLRHNQAGLAEELKSRPLCDISAAHVEGAPVLLNYIALVNGLESEAYWNQTHRPTDFSNMHTAMFHLTGWFDMEKDRTIEHYLKAMRECDAYTRLRQKLIIGPWGHGGALSTIFEGYDFGEENSGERQQIRLKMLEWFDWHLKGKAFKDSKCVRYFIMGKNEWHEDAHWPPENTVQTDWYLGGGARLYENAPEIETASARYLYNPDRPYPSQFQDQEGKEIFADCSVLAGRADVLTYETPLIERALTLLGACKLVLYAATDAKDTDFACRLVDVNEKGKETSLLCGLTRAKYRLGGNASPIVPGEIVEYTIDLGHIAYTVFEGHRLKIHVTSSLYPMHDANPNTGFPLGKSRTAFIAQQHIYHDKDCPSRLLLSHQLEEA